MEQEFLSQIIENTPDPCYTLDPQWRFCYLNKAALKLFQRTKAELLGKNIWKEFPHLINTKLYTEYNRAISQQTTVKFEEYWSLLEMWLETDAFPLQEGLSVHIRDVTAMVEGERFLTSIFESIQDGLCVIDDHLKIVRANSTMEKWYAHEKPLLGKKCHQVYRGASQPCQNCLLNSESTRKDSTYGVIPIRGPGEQSQGCIEVYNFPLKDTTTKQVKGVIKYCRDITEKKRVEQEMARFESLSLIGEMAASIGHEVRNPMTTVRGYLQLFKSKEEFHQYTEQFDLLIDELDRANSIITEFLSLAKNRNIVFNFQNLNSIIETLTPLLKADAMVTEKEIRLKLTTIPNLLLNEKEIRQLIINLVRNGLEAMEPGGRLEIATFCEHQQIVLSIKDQGKGIALNLLEALGTPFLTTKDKGTGLGLAICYSIASKHKARIKVDTNPNGTTFLVYFNIDPAPVDS